MAAPSGDTSSRRDLQACGGRAAMCFSITGRTCMAAMISRSPGPQVGPCRVSMSKKSLCDRARLKIKLALDWSSTGVRSWPGLPSRGQCRQQTHDAAAPERPVSAPANSPCRPQTDIQLPTSAGAKRSLASVFVAAGIELPEASRTGATTSTAAGCRPVPLGQPLSPAAMAPAASAGSPAAIPVAARWPAVPRPAPPSCPRNRHRPFA